MPAWAPYWAHAEYLAPLSEAAAAAAAAGGGGGGGGDTGGGDTGALTAQYGAATEALSHSNEDSMEEAEAVEAAAEAVQYWLVSWRRHVSPVGGADGGSASALC